MLATLEIIGPTAVLTMDDPERRNVLSAEMVSDMETALDHAEAHPDVRALVATGAGRAFCAGAELEVLAAAAAGDFAPVERVYDGFLRVLHSPLVTVAAVQGPAVGAGLYLALACDVRVAGPRASFDTRFLQLGLHPGGGHLWLLQRAIGYQEATAGVLLGRHWDDEGAAANGLAMEVADDPVARAVELTGGLAGTDAALVRRITASLRASHDLAGHDQALSMETAAQRWSTTRPGFADGVARIQAAITRGRRPG